MFRDKSIQNFLEDSIFYVSVERAEKCTSGS